MRHRLTVGALRAALVMPWRANRVLFAAQLGIVVATGLAPVAASWLLRAILDSLAGGRAVGLPWLVTGLAAAGAASGILPHLNQYLIAQSSRAIEREMNAVLFGAVARLAGLCRLEDPVFLDRLNMAQRAGMSVAFVGRNGAGKSTLVKLLCRFYDPDRGRIAWDGVDLRDMDPADLRHRISAVFQDYMAYELSARENIALGDLALAADEALETAASRAGIHDALRALPKGYDTLLTRTYLDLADRDDPQTGVLLSGGQWQRVALARALLRGQRDLVILDEPSSGLDAQAEYEIHCGLRAHRDGGRRS